MTEYARYSVSEVVFATLIFWRTRRLLRRTLNGNLSFQGSESSGISTVKVAGRGCHASNAPASPAEYSKFKFVLMDMTATPPVTRMPAWACGSVETFKDVSHFLSRHWLAFKAGSRGQEFFEDMKVCNFYPVESNELITDIIFIRMLVMTKCLLSSWTVRRT